MRALASLSVAAVLLILAACGEDGGDLSATDRDARFEVDVGERFSVVLESNPSTGFMWALAEPLPRNVVRLVEDRYLEPMSDAIGAGGHQELSFEAVGDGSTFIQLWYVRSFDDPPEPADRAQLEVIVGTGVPAGADVTADGDAPQPAIPDDEAAITVEELLASRPEDEVVVRATVFDDGSGPVLCGALAESFPPQCPGERVPIVNPGHVESEVVLSSSGGVRWSDQPVTAFGVLTDGGFETLVVAVG